MSRPLPAGAPSRKSVRSHGTLGSHPTSQLPPAIEHTPAGRILYLPPGCRNLFLFLKEGSEFRLMRLESVQQPIEIFG
jgi:hypothetical protein